MYGMLLKLHDGESAYIRKREVETCADHFIQDSPGVGMGHLGFLSAAKTGVNA